MKKSIIAVSFALAVLLLAGSAFAVGDEGLGVYVGATDSTVSPPTGADFDVSGSTFGVDYQFPLGDSFSFNPFIMFASEDGTDSSNVPPEDFELDTTILALQLRYWIGGLYLGAHAGRYETEITSTGGTDESLSDTGFGAVLGWEGEGGFVLSLQYDTVTYDTSGGPEVELTTLRALIGYRF